MEGDVRGRDVWLAALAYVPLLVIIPLFVPRKQRFLLYHTRQGLYVFGVFMLLFALTLALAYPILQTKAIQAPTWVGQTLAVMLLFEFVAYCATVLWMVASTLRRRMVMLPVLGEFAGER